MCPRCVQVDRGGCPSNMKPLLVADAAVGTELAHLDAQLRSSGPPDSAARRTAERHADALVADLGWALGGRSSGGKSARLAAWAGDHGWRHTAERIRGTQTQAGVQSGGRVARSGEAAGKWGSAPWGLPDVAGQAAPDNMKLDGDPEEDLMAAHFTVKQAGRGQNAAGKPSPVEQQVAGQTNAEGSQLGSTGGLQVAAGVACKAGARLWQEEVGASHILVTAVYTAAIARTRVCCPKEVPVQKVCDSVWGPLCV